MAKFIKITTVHGRMMLLNTEHIVSVVKGRDGILVFLTKEMRGEENPVRPGCSFEEFEELLQELKDC